MPKSIPPRNAAESENRAFLTAQAPVLPRHFGIRLLGLPAGHLRRRRGNTTGNERHLVAAAESAAHGQPIGRSHGTDRYVLVGHDQRRVLVDEDDDVDALLKVVLGPLMELAVVGLLLPCLRRAAIDLHLDKAGQWRTGEHLPSLIGLPGRADGNLQSPQTLELGALVGKRVVDHAALAGLAMRAPFARGLVD